MNSLVMPLATVGLIFNVATAPFQQFAFVSRTETFTVKELPPRGNEVNLDGSKNTYANLIYTDRGVYSNIDSLIPWKTRSSDVRNQLKEGETYTCQTSGWRIGFLSWYKNIIDCNGFKYE